MWKIKDPAIKEKIMQLLSDESIAKRCKDQMTMDQLTSWLQMMIKNFRSAWTRIFLKTFLSTHQKDGIRFQL